MREFYLTLLVFTSFIILTSKAAAVNNDEEHIDPELTIDRSQWKNPNDPLEKYGVNEFESCNTNEQINAYREMLNKKDEEIRMLQQRLHENPETLAKSIISIIFHTLGININAQDAVYMKADVTIKKDGIETIKRFLAHSTPTEVLKARIQGEMELFLTPAAEAREHPMITFLHRLTPFLIGLDIILVIGLLLYFNVFRSKKTIMFIIIAGLFVHEVNQKVNDDYKKALAERMAREVRMRDNPCAPKGYLSAVGTYFGSMFTRMEDPCVEFYKDALTDTPINTKILSSAFYVIGEMLGSPFIGLAETFQKAIEVYFSPAPLYIQWLKCGLLIFAMICGVVMFLRFWQFEIQSPFLTFRWRVGGVQPLIAQQLHGHIDTSAAYNIRPISDDGRSQAGISWCTPAIDAAEVERSERKKSINDALKPGGLKMKEPESIEHSHENDPKFTRKILTIEDAPDDEQDENPVIIK